MRWAQWSAQDISAKVIVRHEARRSLPDACEGECATASCASGAAAIAVAATASRLRARSAFQGWRPDWVERQAVEEDTKRSAVWAETWEDSEP